MVSLRRVKIELDREVDNQTSRQTKTGKLQKKLHFQDFSTFYDTKDRLLLS